MPKDHKITRVSRRAASKEALKQMKSILVGDDKRYEISSDDDDIIAIDVIEPPKKKYKLSHRKSADNSNREVIVIKKVATVEDYFDIEAVVEELEPCQIAHIEEMQREEFLINEKIELLEAAPNCEVIHRGTYVQALEISEQIQAALSGTTILSSNQTTSVGKVQKAASSQNVVLQQTPVSANNAIPQSYQLVMDPRLGVIVGAVTSSSTKTNSQQIIYKSANTVSNTPEQPMKTRRGTILRQVTSPTQATTPAKTTPPIKGIQIRPMLQKIPIPKPATPTGPTKHLISKPKQIGANISTYRPTESTVEGGLSMGIKSGSNKNTDPEDRSMPDSREVSFNKLQGRTYPSLVVVARPHLRVKDLASDRGKLDVKVKSVLMFQPTKFTEWLIQQGLVRSDQKCSNHPDNPLKLGMYSDATKFPYSGGYVWISECCPQKFVSVFSGSLFEGSQHPPMAILKLLYHWCCQTIVQNVTQWVKVDNLYVKGMYTWLRALCTVGLHTHVKQLGGPGVKVQIGVISLGTTSQDGNKREVKVEVLGILETASKHIRLRAVEPLPDGDRSYKKRFRGILEPVYKWVHPASHIVTDLTVDKQTLHQMGFVNVVQSTSNDYAQSNRTIMEYLRRIVPRMFQNTLSLLSRQIIQQFLDELVWREWYGTTVLQCFDNMLLHMSEQTRYDGGLNKEDKALIHRLNKVVANPFKNWAIPLSTSTSSAIVSNEDGSKRYGRPRKVLQSEQIIPTAIAPSPIGSKTIIASTTITPTSELARVSKATSETPRAIKPSSDISRPSKSTSPDVPEQMVPLENYYYGTVTPTQCAKTKITAPMKCSFCKMSFGSNIALMNHLYKHAHNVSNDVQLCRYCLTIVPTGSDLLKHIDTSHPAETKFDNGFVCLICEAHFRNPFILGKHMSKEHCPSELPYACGTCGFRCSNHKQSVDHFYQQHENGSTIQCPFCLKSTIIFSGGRNISQNMNYFIQHLQKHQKKNLAKRCGRCTLWFIQKEFLKDHQVKFHASQRGKSGLVPSFAPRNGVMVPKSKMDKCPDNSKLINFSTLYFNVSKLLNCKECNQLMGSPKHFVSFERCQNQNCEFSTSCGAAMQTHIAKCKSMHETITNVKLPYEMFCICGYSDTCGNALAKHLAICERKSSYPSMEAAKAATVTHSMLDVLGLVRKADETTSKEPPLILTRSEPLILKQRGRSRKSLLPQSEEKNENEVFEIERKESFEVTNLSISEVKGGVDIDLDLDEPENKSKKTIKKHVHQAIDLTDFDDEAVQKSPDNEASSDTRDSQTTEKQNTEGTMEMDDNQVSPQEDDNSKEAMEQDTEDQVSHQQDDNSKDPMDQEETENDETMEQEIDDQVSSQKDENSKDPMEQEAESDKVEVLSKKRKLDDVSSSEETELGVSSKKEKLEGSSEAKDLEDAPQKQEELVDASEKQELKDASDVQAIDDPLQEMEASSEKEEVAESSDVKELDDSSEKQEMGESLTKHELEDSLVENAESEDSSPKHSLETDETVQEENAESTKDKVEEDNLNLDQSDVQDLEKTRGIEDGEASEMQETSQDNQCVKDIAEVREAELLDLPESRKDLETISKDLIEAEDNDEENVGEIENIKESSPVEEEKQISSQMEEGGSGEQEDKNNKDVEEKVDESTVIEDDERKVIEAEEKDPEEDKSQQEPEDKVARDVEESDKVALPETKHDFKTAFEDQDSEEMFQKDDDADDLESDIRNQIDAFLSESESKSSTHSNLNEKQEEEIGGEKYDYGNITSQTNSNIDMATEEKEFFGEGFKETNISEIERVREEADAGAVFTNIDREFGSRVEAMHESLENRIERLADAPMAVDHNPEILDDHITSDQSMRDLSDERSLDEMVERSLLNDAQTADAIFSEGQSFDYNAKKNDLDQRGSVFTNDALMYEKSNVAADSVTRLDLLESMDEAPVDNCSNAASLAIENNIDTENIEGVFCPMDTTSFT